MEQGLDCAEGEALVIGDLLERQVAEIPQHDDDARLIAEPAQARHQVFLRVEGIGRRVTVWPAADSLERHRYPPLTSPSTLRFVERCTPEVAAEVLDRSPLGTSEDGVERLVDNLAGEGDVAARQIDRAYQAGVL